MNMFDEVRNNRTYVRKSILKNEEASRRLETSITSNAAINEIIQSYHNHDNKLLEQDNELFG